MTSFSNRCHHLTELRKEPNQRPGVDGVWRVLFAFQCPRPRATQAECWTKPLRGGGVGAEGFADSGALMFSSGRQFRMLADRRPANGLALTIR